jgi:hypothetical protein
MVGHTLSSFPLTMPQINSMIIMEEFILYYSFTIDGYIRFLLLLTLYLVHAHFLTNTWMGLQ